MTIAHLPHSTDAPAIVTFEGPECRTVASCKRKLAAYRLTEIRLRAALARDDALSEYLLHTGSGIFAVPPGAEEPGSWIGEPLFS